MLIFKYMSVASDSRTIVVVMLLFVENEYEIGKTVRSLGVSGVTHDYLTELGKLFTVSILVHLHSILIRSVEMYRRSEHGGTNCLLYLSIKDSWYLHILTL